MAESEDRRRILDMLAAGSISVDDAANLLKALGGNQPAAPAALAAPKRLDDLKSRVKRNFQVVFPDADETTWTFSAFVTAYELTAPHDGLLGLNVTLKPTGPIEVEA